MMAVEEVLGLQGSVNPLGSHPQESEEGKSDQNPEQTAIDKGGRSRIKRKVGGQEIQWWRE